MRGEGFISERWFTRHQLLQKINDVARPDLRQISGFQCASCLTGTDRPKAILASVVDGRVSSAIAWR